MTKEQFRRFLSSLIWGYVLIHININLGPLDIFPDWIGYLLIYSAVLLTKEFSFYNAALRPISLIMALWTGLLWIFPSSTSELHFITLVIDVMDLYFHFHLLTLAWNLTYEQGSSPGTRLLQLRNVRTILIIILSLPISWGKYIAVQYAALAGIIITIIWILGVLISYRRNIALDQ